MDKSKIISILLCIFLLIVTASFSVASTNKEKFTDLDGDGINDNAMDANEDGIPDKCAFGFQPERQDLEEMTLKVPTLKPAVRPVANNLQRFGLKTFLTRSFEKCRSTLDREFSSGLGVGMGSSGGACSGGICR